METEEYIVFACRKCGKHIRRSTKKIGTYVSCAKCDCTNRTPGVSGQVTVPAWLLNQMKHDYAKHRLVLSIMAIWVILAATSAYLSPWLGYFYDWIWPFELLGILPIFIAFVITSSRIFPYVGRSEKETRSIVKHCLPLIIILAITDFFTLRSDIRRLEKAAMTAQEVTMTDKQ